MVNGQHPRKSAGSPSRSWQRMWRATAVSWEPMLKGLTERRAVPDKLIAEHRAPWQHTGSSLPAQYAAAFGSIADISGISAGSRVPQPDRDIAVTARSAPQPAGYLCGGGSHLLWLLPSPESIAAPARAGITVRVGFHSRSAVGSPDKWHPVSLPWTAPAFPMSSSSP